MKLSRQINVYVSALIGKEFIPLQNTKYAWYVDCFELCIVLLFVGTIITIADENFVCFIGVYLFFAKKSSEIQKKSHR